MPSLPFWDSDDDDEASAWDECILDDLILPGIADVKVKPKRKLDVKEGSGTDYDTVADKGQRSAEVEIVLRIWEREQFEFWEDVVIPRIWPTAGKGKPDPLPIVHPRAALYRVNAFVLQEIDDDISDEGVMTVKLKGYAWGVPKPSPVKTAEATKPKAGTANADKAGEQAPFNPESSTLDSLVNLLDPKRTGGTPKGQGAPSRDPNAIKP